MTRSETSTQELRLRRPYRLIRVRRSDEGFEIVGEVHERGTSTVQWRIRSCTAASYGSLAESVANSEGLCFARRGPPAGFAGSSFFVDSTGSVTPLALRQTG